jgi:pimeloyl-ACP methyl ester carboxylesterase
MALLRTAGDGTVKIVEQGTGTPVVFLHSGVGSAGEWRDVFSAWPPGYRLVAVDAFRGGSGPGLPGRRTLDDYADQVHAVVRHVGAPVHLVGFSWGGATALHVAATAPTTLASVAVVEPEAYSLLTPDDEPAFTALRNLRDRWRAQARAGDWYAAFEGFIDFYNGPGSFAAWPAARRDAFLAEQRTRGDLWDVLFDAPVTAGSLASVTTPVHVIEGSATSVVDRAICAAVLRGVRHARRSVIDGAGHMIPLSHPADLTRVLVRHLA